MKKQKCLLLLVAAMAFALAACSDLANGEAGEGAYITISLGRSEGRKAVPWDAAVDDGSILHDIYIDENRVGTGVTIGSGVKNYKADPGSHTVSVCGYYPAGTLFSFGKETVNVTTGQKAKCDITMLAAPSLSGNIAISPSGAVTVGTKLTATYSGSEAVSFQWERDGVNVGTASTTKPNEFTPTEEGIYTVTVSATGYKPKASAPVTVNDPSLPTLSGTPTITPSTGVITGTLLTANYSGSEAVTLTYQWEKDDVAITGATGNTYTPTAAGSYTVIVGAAGYNHKTSAAVTVSAPPPLSGNITISPSPGSVVNIVMTATYSGSETITKWQWKKDGADIGTNSNTFTPTATGNYTVTASSASHNPKTSAAVTVYGVGTGTAGDPFNVCNVATLQKVGSETATGGWRLDAHYKQVANIDLNPSVPNWTPIGTFATSDPFTGSYDGGGHTISNLKIPSATDLGQGLFGFIGSGAVVKSVGIVNCNITSSGGFVGGVAGVNRGTVQYCYSTGTVTGDGVGGVVGSNQLGGTVKNCYSECNVTGTATDDGGVVGYNYQSTVQNCYSTGTVSGTSSVGGVAGYIGDADDPPTVKNCYATGTVTATGDDAGGVVGGGQVPYDAYGANSRIINCVALNLNIAGSVAKTMRVEGYIIHGTSGGDPSNPLNNCYGRSDMVGANLTTYPPAPTSYNGADITSANWGSASWWQAQGFTTTDWDFSGVSATHLPKLKGMPGGLEAQNPVIIN